MWHLINYRMLEGENMNGKKKTCLVVIVAIAALFLAQSGLFAAMLIKSKDGRLFQVDIDSNEISSIEFTGETITLPGESLIFEDAFISNRMADSGSHAPHTAGRLDQGYPLGRIDRAGRTGPFIRRFRFIF